MKAAPTLADLALRTSFRRNAPEVMPREIADKIAQARKFMLDKDASAFLADLGHASYHKAGPHNQERFYGIANQTRELARLPHALTWIEYDSRIFRQRTLDLYGESAKDPQGNQLCSPEENVPRLGWLLEQKTETIFSLITVAEFEANSGFAFAMPHRLGWATDDSKPPWLSCMSDGNDAEVAVGLPGFRSPSVTVSLMHGRNIPSEVEKQLIVEFVGELRFVWALLAAVNDIPVGIKHVEQSKGFVAKGRYRKFYDHSVISILLPKGRDPKRVAASIVAISRRRAHMVRGHWRRNWRHAGARSWVKEHERGDATLGHVLHDYKVSHEEPRQ